MSEGFGTWETKEQLFAEINKQIDSQDEKPREMVVGADVVVALTRFGIVPMGPPIGGMIAMCVINGVNILTPLHPKPGCSGCEMGCEQ